MDEPIRPSKHPLAFSPNKSGFYGIMSGDRIAVGDRTGWLDEALHDGEALITYDNGEHDIVLWNSVRKI